MRTEHMSDVQMKKKKEPCEFIAHGVFIWGLVVLGCSKSNIHSLYSHFDILNLIFESSALWFAVIVV